ncbi:hypothetical protein PBCV1_A437aR [Paramecium bursaria Chlorella virus 1]|uniref:Uncharacterized protein n=1 Tax=Paramecium bursaria Chlorella virus 1 TaxID=10506 RepID=F8TU38_PBCV1|nr:hypothetical protein PBCV1_A437aR [Paramecium bursaria Chlorella virus 1]AEI70099.1 hypothetical protein [Paramecium bursaria Chlorella virus 1]
MMLVWPAVAAFLAATPGVAPVKVPIALPAAFSRIKVFLFPLGAIDVIISY